jgi:DNA sulfur modification protein DndD
MSTAEIYIDKLEIENFGPFYGRHCFDFSGIEDRRAILVGGKNGAGKTHLLRSLYLATVGESAAGDLKKVEAGSEATKFDLRESLNRRAASEGVTTSEFEISLSLRDTTGSIGRQLTIVRQIRHRPSSPPVFSAKAYLADNDRWIEDEQQVQKLRDTFLPRHLARFFFFDAERSQNLQLNERDITEGISRVLGLFSYTELENDLHSLIKQKIPTRFGSGSEKERELNKVLSEIQLKKADLKTYQQDIEDKKHTLRDIEDELFDIEDQLQSIGAVDPIEIASLSQQRDEIKETKALLESDLTPNQA